jgi:hypothetical protein
MIINIIILLYSGLIPNTAKYSIKETAAAGRIIVLTGVWLYFWRKAIFFCEFCK